MTRRWVGYHDGMYRAFTVPWETLIDMIYVAPKRRALQTKQQDGEFGIKLSGGFKTGFLNSHLKHILELRVTEQTLGFLPALEVMKLNIGTFRALKSLPRKPGHRVLETQEELPVQTVRFGM